MKNRTTGHLLPVTFFLILFIQSTLIFSQPTYYLDAAAGNDANNGLSPSTPWKTLVKLNQAGISSGSTILFQRGQIFDGFLRPQNSGISYDAYGTGTEPVINGFTNLSSWSSLGNGIYESPCSSCGSKLNLVTLNDSLKAMGRYPNRTDPDGGYLIVDSHTGSSAISDAALSGSPNWGEPKWL